MPRFLSSLLKRFPTRWQASSARACPLLPCPGSRAQWNVPRGGLWEVHALGVGAKAAAAAAAAPAAILGSLCGGGRRSRSRLPDPPSLGSPFLT